MSNVKFRVYDSYSDKNNPEMKTVDILNFDSHGTFFSQYGGPMIPVTEKQSPLEEFIGIYDRHGREIYEGDIIEALAVFGQINFGDEPVVDICVVRKTKRGFYPFSVGGGIDCEHCYSIKSCDIEVIGNIHENPELTPEEE